MRLASIHDLRGLALRLHEKTNPAFNPTSTALALSLPLDICRSLAKPVVIFCGKGSPSTCYSGRQGREAKSLTTSLSPNPESKP